jgi:hypothetical protein
MYASNPFVSIHCFFFSLDFFILYFYYCCTKGTLWYLQNFLHHSIILLYPPSPHSWNSVNRSHFSIYIHVYRIFLPYSPFNPFPYFLSPPTGTHPPDRNCFAFLISVFVKKKKDIFVCLRWLYRVFYCDISMYNNLNWLIPSIFLLSILVPFLWWFL